jgi:hypothetical protein
MMRSISLGALSIGLLAISLGAHAQGRGPGGAPSQSAGQRPAISSQIETGRMTAEARRQEAEARRLQAEARRQEAQARRQAAEANNQSEAARAAHPPNEHAADQAFSAEANAENADRREQRRALRRENPQDGGAE